jgi:hypothetical protein
MPAPPTGNHYPSTPAPGNRNRECYVESETRSLAGYAQCVLLMNMFDNLANIIPQVRESAVPGAACGTFANS